MKKSIIILTLICITGSGFTQTYQDPKTGLPTNDIELGKYYKKKAHNQQLAGWIMLGGGISLIIGSVFVVWEDENAGGGMALVGSISTLASIPLFITGAKNKGRAEILLRSSSIPLSIDPGKNIPVKSLGIGITIGQ